MGSKGRWKNACAFEVSGHGRPYLSALMCIVVAQSMSEVERERERFTCSVRLSEVAEAPIDVLGMNTTETTCTLSFEGEMKKHLPLARSRSSLGCDSPLSRTALVFRSLITQRVRVDFVSE